MPSPSNRVVSRRRFVAASGLALAACLPDAALAASLSPAGTSGENPAQNDPKNKAQAEVEAKLENIIRKYGDRLSQEQRKKARTVLTYHQKLLDSVRSFPLQNGDPPASVLKLASGTEPASATPKNVSGGKS